MLVELKNIQSIGHAVYDIPETGITQIVGENSNGKSILIKAMAFIANSLIKDKEERETIIKDGMDSGIIKMSRNGMTLTVVVSRQRENCIYKLERSDGSTIQRTIREGGLEKIAEEFGWIAFDGRVCLQIFETFGIMPFVNNRLAGDYEIMDYIITDKVANAFIENYASETYPKFKEMVNTYSVTVENCDKMLASISIYDVEAYTEMLQRLNKYKHIVPFMKVCEPSKLPITKYFQYARLTPIEPLKLPVFRIIPELQPLRDLTNEVSNLNLALSGTCPTCGVNFKELEVHSHEV